MENEFVIENGILMKCTGTNPNIVIPGEVTGFHWKAFHGVSGFSSIELPRSMETIGEEALFFYGETYDIIVYDSINPNGNGGTHNSLGWVGYSVDFMTDNLECSHHSIVVKSAETGQVKYRVYMGKGKGTPQSFRQVVANGWGKNASFDFAAMDAAFPQLKEFGEKLEVASNRLRWPVELTQEARAQYEGYISKSAKKIITKCITEDSLEQLTFYAQYGMLKKNNIAAAVEEANAAGKAEIAAWLLNYQNGHFGAAVKKASSMSLSAKAPAEWKADKATPHLVRRYQGKDPVVIFPTEVDGTAITGIADSTSKVPDNYKSMTSVVIPEGYETIGEYAFHGCENLTAVTLPSTLRCIGKHAFENCTNLNTICFPEGLTQIDDCAFLNTGIREWDLPASLTRIGDKAFSFRYVLIYRGEKCVCPQYTFFRDCVHLYTDGEVWDLSFSTPAPNAMPLSYVGLRPKEIMDGAGKELLSGLTVASSGELKAFPAKKAAGFWRPALQTFVETLGGTWAKTASAKADMIVVARIDADNEKIRSWQEKGVTVLTELEFMTQIRAGNKPK